MNIFKEVTSHDLSIELYKLGVKQDSYFVWIKHSIFWSLIPFAMSKKEEGTGTWEKRISAFLSSELGELLPNTVASFSYDEEGRKKEFLCKLHVEGDWSKYIRIETAETEADARAKMLIYLLENKLMTV